MKYWKWRWIVVSLILLMSVRAEAGADGEAYSKAMKAARAGKRDFAYMHYRSILNQYPDSRFSKEALFALGEYHFLLPEYKESYENFKTYVRKYPGSSAEIFAWAHMLKIARSQNNPELVKELENKIISLKPMSFVFRDSKETKFQSPLARRWKAVFHIDKIEFFVGGELFDKISL